MNRSLLPISSIVLLLSLLFSICLDAQKDESSQDVLIKHVTIKVEKIHHSLKLAEYLEEEIIEAMREIFEANDIVCMQENSHMYPPIKNNDKKYYDVLISIDSDASLDCGLITAKLRNQMGLNVYFKRKSLFGVRGSLDDHCEQKIIHQAKTYAKRMCGFLSKDQRDNYLKKPLAKDASKSYKTIQLPDIKNIETGILRDSLTSILDSKDRLALEGIYEPEDVSGGLYTLGIIYHEHSYKIICLSSNRQNWKEGDLKGASVSNINSPGENPTFYWYMANGKMELAVFNHLENNRLRLTILNVGLTRTYKKVY